jgi:hypothetical protein
MSSLFDPGATGLLSLSIHHSNAPVLILLKNPPFILEGSDDAIPMVSRLLGPLQPDTHRRQSHGVACRITGSIFV